MIDRWRYAGARDLGQTNRSRPSNNAAREDDGSVQRHRCKSPRIHDPSLQRLPLSQMHSQASDAADCSDHGVRAQERKPRMISFPGNCCLDATCRRHSAGAARFPCGRSGAWVCKFHRCRIGGFSHRCAGRAGRPRGRDAPRADVGRYFGGRPSRRRPSAGAQDEDLSCGEISNPLGEGAARPRVSNHGAPPHCSSRAMVKTREGAPGSRQDRCQADRVASRSGNPSHSRGLLRTIGCEYTAAADPIDEFITAPTERRQLR